MRGWHEYCFYNWVRYALGTILAGGNCGMVLVGMNLAGGRFAARSAVRFLHMARDLHTPRFLREEGWRGLKAPRLYGWN